MNWHVVFTCAIATLGLSACGTYVPPLNDSVTGGPVAEAEFVNAVSKRIRCDVQDAVIKLYEQNSIIDKQNRNLSFFNDWGVQIALNLTTDDRTSLSPNANVLPPSPPTRIFNLSLGANASSEAQRVNKVGSFFTIQELRSHKICPQEQIVQGPWLLQSDLKLYQWLEAMMLVNGLRDAPFETDTNGPQKTNVFSHEIKFDVVTSGNITPGWKLTEATVNQTGNFLSGSRDRTQDLILTFGPIEKTKTDTKSKTQSKLDETATNQALSSQISVDIANALRNALRQQPNF